MALSEFGLIARFFDREVARDDIALGIGDDAALLAPPAGHQLAVTVDTMVEGIHFRAGDDPEALGHKLLAVNLSDLAAMGAEPAWATLALTLPEADEGWLTAFSRGLFALAADHQVALVGGDTTRGPRTLTLQAGGYLPAGTALCRAGARAGDGIYVSGTLGDAALALDPPAGLAADQLEALLIRLHRPEPRVALGRALRGVATAAIDLSDGINADLGHILAASGAGATLELARLPLSAAVSARTAAGDWRLPLSGGDDYELCFTLPAERAAMLSALPAGVAVTRVGTVEAATGLRCIAPDGRVVDAGGGYQHFREGDGDG